MKNLKELKNKENIIICTLLIVGMILICVFSIIDLEYGIVPVIIKDETGYWANAKAFNGTNWSGIISMFVPYYSYGYSLILALIIRIANNMEQAYQLAILTNQLILCICFLVSYFFFRRLFPNKNKILILFLCFTIQFHPSLLLYSHFGLPEVVLTGTYWISAFSLFLMLEKKSIFSSMVFSFTLGYMYMLHQRTVGIILLSVILVIVLAFYKKITVKQFVYFAIILIIMFSIHTLIKNYLYEVLWNNQGLNLLPIKKEMSIDLASVNDYKGQMSKIVSLFSFGGIKNFLIGFLGKVFSMGIVTFFIGYEGIIYIINNLFLIIKNRKLDQINSVDLILFFWGGSYFITTIIATIFLIEPIRVDLLIYGRYTDWLLGPVIVLGYLMLQEKSAFKRYSLYTLYSIVILFLLQNHISQYNIPRANSVSTPILHYFIIRDGVDNYGKWTTNLLLTFLFWGVIIWVNKLIINKKIVMYINCVLMILTWNITTQPAKEYYIQTRREEVMKIDELKSIAELLKTEKKIYYIYDVADNPDKDMFIGNIQYLMTNSLIWCASQERIGELEKVKVIIPSNHNLSDLAIEKYEILINTSNYNVIEIK